ncbi:MAG: SDR family oxidoreductase [Bacteroidales bacterium]|nr:SDR family oxidoreductase [Bacteroidales bacterium]
MNYKNFDISGKKAVITGGSKGIGYAIAKELSEAGCEIIIVGRDEMQLSNAVKSLSASEMPVYNFKADVSMESERTKLIHFIEKTWGKLDILVNNVGTNIRKKIHDYSAEEIQLLFSTNLFSAVDLSRRLLPLLQKAENSNIINISSVAGLGHLKTGAIYGMTKAALIQLTKNLAVEWASENIRVNAIAPWYIDTPLAKQVLKDPDYLKEVLSSTPMKRIGKPEEVSGLVRFLCSPAAGYITGQCIAVDGGFSINLFS